MALVGLKSISLKPVVGTMPIHDLSAVAAKIILEYAMKFAYAPQHEVWPHVLDSIPALAEHHNIDLQHFVNALNSGQTNALAQRKAELTAQAALVPQIQVWILETVQAAERDARSKGSRLAPFTPATIREEVRERVYSLPIYIGFGEGTAADNFRKAQIASDVTSALDGLKDRGVLRAMTRGEEDSQGNKPWIPKPDGKGGKVMGWALTDHGATFPIGALMPRDHTLPAPPAPTDDAEEPAAGFAREPAPAAPDASV